jgi:hypothetical protein
MNLIHNERIKLLAGAFNTLGVGTILSGIVVPLVGGRFSGLMTPIWLVVGAGMIGLAQAMLGRLRE